RAGCRRTVQVEPPALERRLDRGGLTGGELLRLRRAAGYDRHRGARRELPSGRHRSPPSGGRLDIARKSEGPAFPASAVVPRSLGWWLWRLGSPAAEPSIEMNRLASAKGCYVELPCCGDRYRANTAFHSAFMSTTVQP